MGNSVVLRLLLVCCLFGAVLQSTAWAAPGRLVRIGAFNYYPAIFQDADGKIKGFYVDALNDLAERENLRIEYVYGSWAEGLERIQTGEVDVLTSVAYTEERAHFLDYSKTPLLTVWGELYVPLASEIVSIKEMQDKTVAVMKNDFNGRSFMELADKFGIRCRYVEFPGFEEVFQAVARRKVDAGVASNTFGSPKQREYRLRSTGIVFNPFDIHFAVAKGKNADLLALLENYLHRWRYEEDSIYLKARENWDHGVPDKVPVVPQWLLILLVALGSATLLGVSFILLLRRQVARATKALREREVSLKETTQMKRLLLDSAAEGLLGLDLDGFCTFCNKTGLRMLGYEREEQIVSHKAHDLILHTRQDGAPDAADACRLMQVSRAARQYHGDDETLRRSDGSFFPVEYWSRPILREGRHIGSVFTFVDISERKQLEESYRFICRSGYQDPADDFFQALVRHLAESLNLDFVCVGRLKGGKQAVKTIAVYQNGAIVSNFTFPLQGTPCAETLLRSVYCCPQGVRGRFPEYHLLMELGGESYAGATLYGFDGHPIGVIAGIGRKPLARAQVAESILKLISLRAAGELERQQAAEELRRKNREMEQFTYAVSHDLRSPLVTIQTFLDYLRQDLADGSSEAVEKDLGFISGAAQKMSGLLEDLLRMSRIGRLANAPVEVSFAELVEDALLAVAGAIKERKVEIQLASEPITLYGDRPRLAEIWQNLVDNAVKYMGDQASPRVEIGLQNENGERVFYVRDNGMGIDPRYRQKIFGLFEKLNSASEGSGLGLSLVKKIVELNQGRIWAESAGPGCGSCFLFTLPAAFSNPGNKEGFANEWRTDCDSVGRG